MSASLAPECNEVKEWVALPTGQASANRIGGDMTTASSNGTVKVRELSYTCNLPPLTSVEYLRGAATSDECEPMFKQYEQCLKVQHHDSTTVLFPLIPLQKVLKSKGIDSMLKEAREDNRENDAEHLHPVSWPVSLSTQYL